MSVLISAIEGNRQRLDGGAMFGNAPRMVWQKWLSPDEQHRIELACRALLIESEGLKILCETGIGAFFAPKLAERYGVQTPEVHQLLRHLKNIGVAPEEITHVVLSHLHFDHAGGLLPTYQEIAAGNNALQFPRAQYVVSQGAWERSCNPHPRDRASFIPGLNEKLLASGRLQIVPAGARHLPFAPQLACLLYSSGHTPEHMHVLVQGQQHRVLFCGDLIPGLPWVHTPITMGYDRFPELLIDEKSKVCTQAAAEEWFLFFTHDPSVAMARVRYLAEEERMRPYDEMKILTRFAI
jgi:glyoxylase-like metal-dependent hydrolase (beta-lactamase superfamily II)